MIATIIIAVLLAGYAGFVIRRRVKQIKEGKFCSCGCESCGKGCEKPSKKRKKPKDTE